MEINEIKKALYKEKPLATLTLIRNGNANYSTKLEDGSDVLFEVPVSDMGESGFYPSMDAKLLIRWIVKI